MRAIAPKQPCFLLSHRIGWACISTLSVPAVVTSVVPAGLLLLAFRYSDPAVPISTTLTCDLMWELHLSCLWTIHWQPSLFFFLLTEIAHSLFFRFSRWWDSNIPPFKESLNVLCVCANWSYTAMDSCYNMKNTPQTVMLWFESECVHTHRANMNWEKNLTIPTKLVTAATILNALFLWTGHYIYAG